MEASAFLQFMFLIPTYFQHVKTHIFLQNFQASLFYKAYVKAICRSILRNLKTTSLCFPMKVWGQSVSLEASSLSPRCCSFERGRGSVWKGKVTVGLIT